LTFTPNGILPGTKFTFRQNLAFSYIDSVTAVQGGTGALGVSQLCGELAFSRMAPPIFGRAVSRWTSARIVVYDCLSQVKIDVTTVNNISIILAMLKISGEFFIFQQDSAQAHTARQTISILACNFAKR